jgi:hypothetical protein
MTAMAVVIDDRVAVLAARARRHVLVRGRTAAEDHDALLATADSSEDDHMVRSTWPLPDELDALRTHACADPEDVRRPGSGGRSSLRCRRRRAIVPPKPLRGGLLPSSRRCRSCSTCLLPSGRRCRSCTTLKLEPHSRRRAILPREETARSGTRNKHDRCQDRCPPPAPWPRAGCLGRPAGTRSSDRSGRRPRPRLLAGLRKKRARSFGQCLVDESELRADRAQLFGDARGGPQRRAAPGRRALNDLWPRRHARSLTKPWWRFAASCDCRKKVLFASFSSRNQPQ